MNWSVIKVFATLILFAFAIFGLFISTNLVHELSHKQDYADILKTNETVCILTNPFTNSSWTGFYSVQPANIEESKKMDKIHQVTEYKAYFMDFLLVSIFLIAIILYGESYMAKKS